MYVENEKTAEFEAQLLGAMEALLFVAELPIPAKVMAAALQIEVETAEAMLNHLQALYNGELAGSEAPRSYGWCLRQVGGGWRLYTQPQFAPVVKDYLSNDAQAKLSQAALETLAVIAYRQPVTRSGVAKIRGVNVDGVVRTLLAHGLIEPAGMSLSGAITYQTTAEFLEKAGLDSLDQLPPLAPLLPSSEELDELDQGLS